MTSAHGLGTVTAAQPKRTPDRRHKTGWLQQPRQRDQDNRVGVGVAEPLRDSRQQPGLAHPTRTGEA